MQTWLRLRSSISSSNAGSPETPPGRTQERFAQLTQHLAKYFHDINKAEDALHKINNMRDNHIFKGLATLASPNTSLETAQKVGKDTVQRIGSKGATGDFAKSLFTRLTPSLVSGQVVDELLGMALRAADDPHNKGREQAALRAFLADTAKVAPSLFAGCIQQVSCWSYIHPAC